MWIVIRLFSVAQSKEPQRSNIKRLLDRCGFTYSEGATQLTVYAADWWSHFREFGKCRNKFIPDFAKNVAANQLEILFQTMVDGDGHWAYPGQSGQFYSFSKQLADDFAEIAVKLGFCVDGAERQRPNRIGLEYRIDFKKRDYTEVLTGNHVYNVETKTKRGPHVRRVPYSGPVYCIGVPEHHSFVIRQNGSVWISGNSWVKRTWVDPAAPLSVWQASKDEGGMTRQYIPARLIDNPTLTETSPDYEDQIKGLGSPELVQAMLNGDWDVVAGCYFPEFTRSSHVVEPHRIPDHWPRFRSMDWGSASPFAVHWWAISDGTDLYGVPIYPRGSLICYREWYGAEKPNVGLKLSVEEVANGILQRDKEAYGESVIRVRPGPADPSIFKEDGGPSIAEQFRKCGVSWHRGDNKRIPGWQALRNRLVGDNFSEGRPTIYFFNTCLDSIRTIPEMQHAAHDPNDLETRSDDHCCDSIRYMCMHRASAKDKEEGPKAATIQEATLDELWEAHEESLRNHPMVRY